MINERKNHFPNDAGPEEAAGEVVKERFLDQDLYKIEKIKAAEAFQKLGFNIGDIFLMKFPGKQDYARVKVLNFLPPEKASDETNFQMMTGYLKDNAKELSTNYNFEVCDINLFTNGAIKFIKA